MAINKTYNNNITINPTASTVDITGHNASTAGLKLGGTLVTASAAELNTMDGITASTAELNIMDGVTSSTAELNILDGVTSSTAELNILDGVTATASEINVLDGITASTAELNIMDGVTLTASEINALASKAIPLITLNASSLTVTAATHAGSIINITYTGADTTITLPAATGTGNIYRFIIGATDTNQRIIKVADNTDVFYGYARHTNGSTFVTAADSDTITLNGQTKGGYEIGGTVQLIDFATNQWSIVSESKSNGGSATPFSATV